MEDNKLTFPQFLIISLWKSVVVRCCMLLTFEAYFYQRTQLQMDEKKQQNRIIWNNIKIKDKCN